MDKESEVVMTPALELKTRNATVRNKSLTLEVRPRSIKSFTKVNGDHLQEDGMCHPDHLDIEANFKSTLSKSDASGDHLTNQPENLVKEALESSNNSCVFEDGSGDFSAAIKRQNNQHSSKSSNKKPSESNFSNSASENKDLSSIKDENAFARSANETDPKITSEENHISSRLRRKSNGKFAPNPRISNGLPKTRRRGSEQAKHENSKDSSVDFKKLKKTSIATRSQASNLSLNKPQNLQIRIPYAPVQLGKSVGSSRISEKSDTTEASDNSVESLKATEVIDTVLKQGISDLPEESEVTDSLEESEVIKSSEKSQVTKSLEESSMDDSQEKSVVIDSLKKPEIMKCSEKSQVIDSPEESEMVHALEGFEVIKSPKESKVVDSPEKSLVVDSQEESETINFPEKSQEVKSSEDSKIFGSPEKSEIVDLLEESTMVDSLEESEIIKSPEKSQMSEESKIGDFQEKSVMMDSLKKSEIIKYPEESQVTSSPEESEIVNPSKVFEVVKFLKESEVVDSQEKSSVMDSQEESEIIKSLEKPQSPEESEMVNSPEESMVMDYLEESSITKSPGESQVTSSPEKSEIVNPSEDFEMVKSPKESEVVDSPEKSSVMDLQEESEVVDSPEKSSVMDSQEESEIIKSLETLQSPEESEMLDLPEESMVMDYLEESPVTKSPGESQVTSSPQKSEIVDSPEKSEMIDSQKESLVMDFLEESEIIKSSEESVPITSLKESDVIKSSEIVNASEDFEVIKPSEKSPSKNNDVVKATTDVFQTFLANLSPDCPPSVSNGFISAGNPNPAHDRLKKLTPKDSVNHVCRTSSAIKLAFGRLTMSLKRRASGYYVKENASKDASMRSLQETRSQHFLEKVSDDLNQCNRESARVEAELSQKEKSTQKSAGQNKKLKMSLEATTTNAGVILKDLKWMRHKIDEDQTDESTEDEDEPVFTVKRPALRRKRMSSKHSATEYSQNTSTVYKDMKATKEYASGRIENGRKWIWLDSQRAHFGSVCQNLESMYARLRIEKGPIELEEPFTRSHNQTTCMTADMNSAKVSHQSSEDFNHHNTVKEVRTDPTCTAARTRGIKSWKKRRLVVLTDAEPDFRKYDSCRKDSYLPNINAPLRNDSPHFRSDGKLLNNTCDYSFGDWATLHDHAYHQNLSRTSDIGLEAFVSTFVSTNIGWFHRHKEPSKTNDKRKETGARLHQQQLPPPSNSTRLSSHHKSTDSINHNPHHRNKKHPMETDHLRENRKRRYSTQSLENKRARTMSETSDHDSRSQASTPTYLEHNPSSTHFQSQMKRRRTDNIYATDSSVLKTKPYKDIETPKWEKVDLSLLLSSQEATQGATTSPEVEEELKDQMEAAYCRRHDHYEVLEKRKYVAYIEWNKNNKKNGANNRVGSRANLPTGSRAFLRNNAEKSSPLPPSASTSATMECDTTLPEAASSSPATTTTGAVNMDGSPTADITAPSYHAEELSPTQPTTTAADDDHVDFNYWEKRTFPLTDEEASRLAPPEPPVLPIRPHVELPYSRFWHLGAEGMRIPRFNTNTALRFRKGDPHTASSSHHHNHKNSRNRRKSFTNHQRKNSGAGSYKTNKRKRKYSGYSSTSSSGSGTDDNFSDSETDATTGYDSERTLSCSENEGDFDINDYNRYHQPIPTPAAVKRLKSNHQPSGSSPRPYRRRNSSDNRRTTTKHKRSS